MCQQLLLNSRRAGFTSGRHLWTKNVACLTALLPDSFNSIFYSQSRKVHESTWLCVQCPLSSVSWICLLTSELYFLLSHFISYFSTVTNRLGQDAVVKLWLLGIGISCQTLMRKWWGSLWSSAFTTTITGRMQVSRNTKPGNRCEELSYDVKVAELFIYTG